MVTRSGERRRGCGITGAGLRSARDDYKVRRALYRLWGNWGRYEVGARWLQGQESVIGVVGYYGVIKRGSAAALRLQSSD